MIIPDSDRCQCIHAALKGHNIHRSHECTNEGTIKVLEAGEVLMLCDSCIIGEPEQVYL